MLSDIADMLPSNSVNVKIRVVIGTVWRNGKNDIAGILGFSLFFSLSLSVFFSPVYGLDDLPDDAFRCPLDKWPIVPHVGHLLPMKS